MATVNVLMIVDVEGALAASPPSLGGNIYLIDTNKYMGSSGEGQNELSTTLNEGDTIVWSVAPVDPSTQLAITGFSGSAVDAGYIQPTPQGADYTSKFNVGPHVPAGDVGFYNATFQFEGGQSLSWDPHLVLKNAT